MIETCVFLYVVIKLSVNIKILNILYFRSSGTHITPGSRKVKKRSQVRQTGRSSDSDDATQFSEDSLKSGTNSHNSSRPGSGSSRRRRRPTPRHGALEAPVKRRRAGSSGEGDYAATESDGSVYSEDSLTGGEKQTRRENRIVDADDVGERTDQGSFKPENEPDEGDSERVGLRKVQDIDQCDLVNHASTSDASVRDTSNDMSFRAHFTTPRKYSLQKQNNDEIEPEEPTEADRISISPISVWSGGSTSRDGDFGKPSLVTLGEQQPESFRVPSVPAHHTERLSIREPEVWSNSSFVPSVEMTDGSANTEAAERPMSKAKRKRSLDVANKNEAQQQKLKNLHFKYGLLGDDEEDRDDQRGEEYEDGEGAQGLVVAEGNLSAKPPGVFLDYQVLEQSQPENITSKYEEDFNVAKDSITRHAVNKDAQALHIALNESASLRKSDSGEVGIPVLPSVIYCSVSGENSSASSGVDMSSPKSRSLALMQENDTPDSGVATSSSVEQGLSSITSPTFTTSGHYSVTSDDQESFQTLESTQDDIFHSVDESVTLTRNNDSSGTIGEYHTPLQSPRLECKHKQKGNALNEHKSLGPAINTDKVLVITDETVRQALKEEVERKLTRLERRIRSLSDSAISSDYYTDPDSCSVSPRCSRLRDLTSAVTHIVPVTNIPGYSVVANDDGPSEDAKLDDTIPYTLPSTAHRESSLRRPESTQYPYEAPVPLSSQGRFPERLVNAILTIKEYPVFLSPSLRRLQRRRIRGRLTRSMNDIRDLEKTLEVQKLENASEADKQAFRFGEDSARNFVPKLVSNSKESDPLGTNLLQSAFHLSYPESLLHQMRQNSDREARLDQQFRGVMASRGKKPHAVSDDSVFHPPSTVSDPPLGKLVFGLGQYKPSESQIRRLQAARNQLRDVTDGLQVHRYLDSQYFLSEELSPSQKRLAVFKIPSQSDIPSQLEQTRDETRFQAKLAVLRSASVDYLACPDPEHTVMKVDNGSSNPQIASPRKADPCIALDTRGPSSPRKFRPKSYTSSLNSSFGILSGLVSRSADSILTSNDSFDSPRYRGNGETYPLLLDRSASMDDIYYHRLMNMQTKQQTLNRSRSTGMVDAGNGEDIQDESDEQIFPPALHVEYADDEINQETDSFGDADVELGFYNQSSASLVSTVGFSYRKASHPRDFRGFNEEMRQQIEHMTHNAAEQEKTLQPTKSLSDHNLSPRSDSSEYSSDSYFKAAEVESGIPYFREYRLNDKPIQSENGCQTDQGQNLRSIKFSNNSLQRLDQVREDPSIPLSQGAENWQEVSKVVMENTDLLRKIRSKSADLAPLDLDSSGESFNTETITGRSLSSKGDSPRKKMRTRSADLSTTQFQEKGKEDSEKIQRRNSQLADNITAVMHDLTSQEVKLPLELQQRILEEFLRTQHERELEEYQQQQQHFEQDDETNRETDETTKVAKHVRESLPLSPVDERHTMSDMEYGGLVDEEIMTDHTDVLESSTQTSPRKWTEQTEKIIIKVRDTMTQTGSSLNNSISEEIQTDVNVSFDSEENEGDDVHLIKRALNSDPVYQDARSSRTDTPTVYWDSHGVQTTLKLTNILKDERERSDSVPSSLRPLHGKTELAVNAPQSGMEQLMFRSPVDLRTTARTSSKDAQRLSSDPDSPLENKSFQNEEVQTDWSLNVLQKPAAHVALSTDDLPQQDDLVLYPTEKLCLSGPAQSHTGETVVIHGDTNKTTEASNNKASLQTAPEVYQAQITESEQANLRKTKPGLPHAEASDELKRRNSLRSVEELHSYVTHEDDRRNEAQDVKKKTEEEQGKLSSFEDESSNPYQDTDRIKTIKQDFSKSASFDEDGYDHKEEKGPIDTETMSYIAQKVRMSPQSKSIIYEEITASKGKTRHIPNLPSKFPQDSQTSNTSEDKDLENVSSTYSENDDNISSSVDETPHACGTNKDERSRKTGQKDSNEQLVGDGTHQSLAGQSEGKSLKNKKKKKRKRKKKAGGKLYPEDETDSQVSDSVALNEPSSSSEGLAGKMGFVLTRDVAQNNLSGKAAETSEMREGHLREENEILDSPVVSFMKMPSDATLRYNTQSGITDSEEEKCFIDVIPLSRSNYVENDMRAEQPGSPELASQRPQEHESFASSTKTETNMYRDNATVQIEDGTVPQALETMRSEMYVRGEPNQAAITASPFSLFVNTANKTEIPPLTESSSADASILLQLQSPNVKPHEPGLSGADEQNASVDNVKIQTKGNLKNEKMMVEDTNPDHDAKYNESAMDACLLSPYPIEVRGIGIDEEMLSNTVTSVSYQNNLTYYELPESNILDHPDSKKTGHAGEEEPSSQAQLAEGSTKSLPESKDGAAEVEVYSQIFVSERKSSSEEEVLITDITDVIPIPDALRSFTLPGEKLDLETGWGSTYISIAEEKSDAEVKAVLTEAVLVPNNKGHTFEHDAKEQFFTGTERKRDCEEDIAVTDQMATSNDPSVLTLSTSIKERSAVSMSREKIPASADRKSDSEEKVVVTDVIPIFSNPASANLPIYTKERGPGSTSNEKLGDSAERKSESEEKAVMTHSIPLSNDSKNPILPISSREQTQYHTSEEKFPISTERKSDSEEEVVLTDVIPISSSPASPTLSLSTKERVPDFTPDEKRRDSKSRKSDSEEEVVVTDVIPIYSSPASPTLPISAKEQAPRSASDGKLRDTIETKSDPEEKAVATDLTQISNSSAAPVPPISTTAQSAHSISEGQFPVITERKSDSEEELVVTDVIPISDNSTVTPKEQTPGSTPGVRLLANTEGESEFKKEVEVTDVVNSLNKAMTPIFTTEKPSVKLDEKFPVNSHQTNEHGEDTKSLFSASTFSDKMEPVSQPVEEISTLDSDGAKDVLVKETETLYELSTHDSSILTTAPIDEDTTFDSNAHQDLPGTITTRSHEDEIKQTGHVTVPSGSQPDVTSIPYPTKEQTFAREETTTTKLGSESEKDVTANVKPVLNLATYAEATQEENLKAENKLSVLSEPLSVNRREQNDYAEKETVSGTERKDLNKRVDDDFETAAYKRGKELTRSSSSEEEVTFTDIVSHYTIETVGNRDVSDMHRPEDIHETTENAAAKKMSSEPVEMSTQKVAEDNKVSHSLHDCVDGPNRDSVLPGTAQETAAEKNLIIGDNFSATAPSQKLDLEQELSVPKAVASPTAREENGSEEVKINPSVTERGCNSEKEVQFISRLDNEQELCAVSSPSRITDNKFTTEMNSKNSHPSSATDMEPAYIDERTKTEHCVAAIPAVCTPVENKPEFIGSSGNNGDNTPTVRNSVSEESFSPIESLNIDGEEEKPQTQTISVTVTKRGDDFEEKMTVTDTISVPVPKHKGPPGMSIPGPNLVSIFASKKEDDTEEKSNVNNEVPLSVFENQASPGDNLAETVVAVTEKEYNSKELERINSSEEKQQKDKPKNQYTSVALFSGPAQNNSSDFKEFSDPEPISSGLPSEMEFSYEEMKQAHFHKDSQVPIELGEVERHPEAPLAVDENQEKLLTTTLHEKERNYKGEDNFQSEGYADDGSTQHEQTITLKQDERDVTSTKENALHEGLERETHETISEQVDISATTGDLESVRATTKESNPGVDSSSHNDGVFSGAFQSNKTDSAALQGSCNSHVYVDRKAADIGEENKGKQEAILTTAMVEVLPEGNITSSPILDDSVQNLSESHEPQRRFMVAKPQATRQEVLRSTLMSSAFNSSARLRQTSETEADYAPADPSNDSGFLSDDTLLTFRSSETEFRDSSVRVPIDSVIYEKTEDELSPTKTQKGSIEKLKSENEAFSENSNALIQRDQRHAQNFEIVSQDILMPVEEVEQTEPSYEKLKETDGSLDQEVMTHSQEFNVNRPAVQFHRSADEVAATESETGQSNLEPSERETEHYSFDGTPSVEKQGGYNTQQYNFEINEKLNIRDHSNGKGDHQNGKAREKAADDHSQQNSPSQVPGNQSMQERKQHGASPPPPPPPPHWQTKMPQAALDYDLDDEEETEPSSHGLDGLRLEQFEENVSQRKGTEDTQNTNVLPNLQDENILAQPLESNRIETLVNNQQHPGSRLISERNVQESVPPAMSKSLHSGQDNNCDKATPRSSSSSDEEMVVVDEVFIVPLQTELVKAEDISKADDTTLVSRQIQRYHGRSKRRDKNSDSCSEYQDLPEIPDSSPTETVEGHTDLVSEKKQDSQEKQQVIAPLDENLLKPVSGETPKKKKRRSSKQAVEYELNDDEDEAGIKLEYVLFDKNMTGMKVGDQTSKDEENIPQNRTQVHVSHPDEFDTKGKQDKSPQEKDVSDELRANAHDQELLAFSEAFSKELKSTHTPIRWAAEKATEEAFLTAGGSSDRLDNLNTICIATSFPSPITTASQVLTNRNNETEDDGSASKQSSEFKFETWERKSIYNFEDEGLRDRAQRRRKVRHASDYELNDASEERILLEPLTTDKDTNQGPYPHGFGFFWQTPAETSRGPGRHCSFQRANSSRSASVHDYPFSLSDTASDTLVFPLSVSENDQSSDNEKQTQPPVDMEQAPVVEDLEILTLAEAMIDSQTRNSDDRDEEVCLELRRQWDDETSYPSSETNNTQLDSAPETPIGTRDLEILLLAEEVLRSGDKESEDVCKLSSDLVREWDGVDEEVIVPEIKTPRPQSKIPDIKSNVVSHSKGVQVSIPGDDAREGEVSYRKEETLQHQKPSIQPPKKQEYGPELKQEGLSLDNGLTEWRTRSLSDPVTPRSEELPSLWQPEFTGGRDVVISVPPASTLHPVLLHHSLSSPGRLDEEPAEHSRRTRRRSGRQRERDMNSEYAEDSARERSPLLRRSHIYSNGVDMSVSNQQIQNEIEKLKDEHSKMMALLERSKERKAMKEKGKAAAPSIADTDSSGGDSPVTVIAGPGSVSDSNRASPTSTSSSHTSSPPTIVGNRPIFCKTDDTSDRVRILGVRNDTQISLIRNLDLQDSPRSTADIREQPETNKEGDDISESKRSQDTHEISDLNNSQYDHTDQDQSSFDDNIEELLLRVPDFTGVGPSTTLFDHANTVTHKGVPRQDACTSPISEFVNEDKTVSHRSTSPTDQHDKRTADLIKATTETLSVRTHQDSLNEPWPPANMDESFSPNSRLSVVSPLTLEAILDDDDEVTDADSAFSTSTAATSADRHRRHQNQLYQAQMVSTGIEASVASLDDSTQTEDMDQTYDDSTLHSSMLGGAHGGASSDSSGHEMSMVHRELDRLHRERVEIIELLSLNYLPSSLTIELLEAKLNYCIGQTDTLLATLEDAWAVDDGNQKQAKRSKTEIKISQDYLNEYKSEFIRSKRDIESCLETYQRRQTGARGRRRTRGRDLRAMRRRAEIEAFQLERLREQCRYERQLNRSRPRTHSQSSLSQDDTSSVTSSSLQTDFSPRKRMTPSQRKDHLVSLRKQIVLSTAGEMLDMRNRSMSPRATSSDSYWALQPSYSAPQSPARSESPDVGSSDPGRYNQTRRGSSSSWHTIDNRYGVSPARSLPDTTERRNASLEVTRPHSVDPLLSISSTLPSVRGNLSSDLRINVMASLTGPDMSADRLIQESNEVRRQNQRQIEKAKEMLRHLDEKRNQIKSDRPPVRSSQLPGKSHLTGAQTHEQRRLPSETSSPLSSSTEFRMRFSRDLAPGQTSSPRVPSSGASSFTEYARDHLVRGQRHIDSWASRTSPHTHHSYFPRGQQLGTGNYMSTSSSSLDNHRLSDSRSPVATYGRRVNSLSPASHSLSPENQAKTRTSDSALSASRSLSQESPSPGSTAPPSRHRSLGAYHSSNYLRPLSMNYPAHRHLVTSSQPSPSGSFYETDPEDHGFSSSSRSSSRDRDTLDHLQNFRSVPRPRSSQYWPSWSSSSPVQTFFPSTTTGARTPSNQTNAAALSLSLDRSSTRKELGKTGDF
ncbi:kinesin-like protein KIF16B [Elysia marginata]|uniref:Kinesin-like protein KIF16B n=1 Tax=Elysia marginata TaxID=1093978 RepID=A0AAV4JGK2_9GAST|nr:kinesin-like protein KIF16B [Elysia marginata]